MPLSGRKQLQGCTRLFRFREITACRARAVDGELGIVDDLYVDPRLWKLRFIGVILEDRTEEVCALIPPFTLEPIRSIGEPLEIQLLRQEILQAPGTLPGSPVTRERETGLYSHYGWPGYWEAGDIPERGGQGQTPFSVRPARDLIGLELQASDMHLGMVEDLLFDDLRWELRYLQVDPMPPASNGRWLISTRWLAASDWRGRLQCEGITAERLHSAPRYSADTRISRDDEVALHRHFGRPLNPV